MCRSFTWLLVCFAYSIGPTTTWEFEYSGRIVGGQIAEIYEIPYQLSMEYEDDDDKFRHVCGASIIRRTWAVTAAHCTHGKDKDLIRLRAGTITRERGGQIHEVEEIFIHPNFSNTSLDYDVSVIKVSKPFEYNDTILPIRLAPTAPPAETPVLVSGWGTSRSAGKFSRHLRKVTVYILNQLKCTQFYKGELTPRMVCSVAHTGRKGPCRGDDGGPLVAHGELVGIVSWGGDCGNMGYPAVYANVADLRNWIVSVAYVSDRNSV